jgi:hypothetical protein
MRFTLAFLVGVPQLFKEVLYIASLTNPTICGILECHQATYSPYPTVSLCLMAFQNITTIKTPLLLDHKCGQSRCSANTQSSPLQVERQSANYQPSFWSYDFVQSLNNHYAVITGHEPFLYMYNTNVCFIYFTHLDFNFKIKNYYH